MITEKLLNDLKRKGLEITLGKDVQPPEVLETGWPSIDAAIGGIAAGRISYIWGPRGAGKTTLCYGIANSFIEAGGWVLYVDAEKSFDAKWAGNFVDTEQLMVVHPGTGGGEAQVDGIKALLESVQPPALVVVDSLAALTSSKAMDRDLEKALMGVDAAFNNRAMRILNIVNRNTAIVVVGQHREGLGKWDYIPGGSGIQHLATLILRMKSSPLRAADSEISDEEDRQQIGILARWQVQKNKLGMPYATGYEAIYRDGFVDKFDSELRIALGKNLVIKGGAWYSLPDGTKVQGKGKFRAWAEENLEEWEMIKNEVGAI